MSSIEVDGTKEKKGEELDKKWYKDWKPDLLRSSDILTVDPDLIWQNFGTFGKYQFLNLLMVSFPSLVYSGLMMVMPFLTELPEQYGCAVMEGFKGNYSIIDKCTVLDLNTGENRTCLSLLNHGTIFSYGGLSKDHSLTSQFDLVCEQADLREHGSSSFLFGAMFGATVISFLSDKLGRRKSFIISIVISMFVNILTALSPSYYIFLVLRFVAGFGLGGNLNIGYVMMSEVVAPKTREFTPFVAAFFWVMGYMGGGVARAYIDSWRWAYFTINLPGVLATVGYFKYFPESLHWQVSNRKKDDIYKQIQRATRINKIQINVQECLNTEMSSDDTASIDSKQNMYILILKTPKLLYHFLLSSFLMVVMNLTYWALSLFSTELSDQKMTGFFLSGIIEIPSAIFAVFLLKMMKRRPVSSLMFTMTAISLAISAFIPAYLTADQKRVVTFICPLLAKMFNSIVWSVLPLAMSEMIPTVIRNSFSGGVCFLGDAGSVAAPYLEYLNRFGPNTASLLIASLTGICAIGVLTMPETKGVHLGSGMDTFDEGPFLKTIRRTFSKKLNSEVSIANDEQVPMMETSGSTPEVSTQETNDDGETPTFFS